MGLCTYPHWGWASTRASTPSECTEHYSCAVFDLPVFRLVFRLTLAHWETACLLIVREMWVGLPGSMRAS